MDWLLRLLLRLVLVPLGIVAGFVATMTVVLIGDWRLGELLAQIPPDQAAGAYEWLAAAAYLVLIVAFAMWTVALIGILFAEAFAVRSWMFHVGNGALSAWLATSLFGPYEKAPPSFNGDLYVIGAGLAGGIVYWLVAGWSAGFWKPMLAVRAPLPPTAPLPAPPPAAPMLPPPAPPAP